MSSDLPAISDVISKINSTIAEFRGQCTDWERDFELLLEEFDELDCGAMFAQPPTASWKGESLFDDLEQRLFGENQRLLERQDQMLNDITDLRKLILEQSEKLSELLRPAG